eukprot:Clim_evm44s7 gene=Clim_evmTU44s7
MAAELGLVAILFVVSGATGPRLLYKYGVDDYMYHENNIHPQDRPQQVPSIVSGTDGAGNSDGAEAHGSRAKGVRPPGRVRSKSERDTDQYGRMRSFGNIAGYEGSFLADILSAKSALSNEAFQLRIDDVLMFGFPTPCESSRHIGEQGTKESSSSMSISSFTLNLIFDANAFDFAYAASLEELLGKVAKAFLYEEGRCGFLSKDVAKLIDLLDVPEALCQEYQTLLEQDVSERRKSQALEQRDLTSSINYRDGNGTDQPLSVAVPQKPDPRTQKEAASTATDGGRAKADDDQGLGTQVPTVDSGAARFFRTASTATNMPSGTSTKTVATKDGSSSNTTGDERESSTPQVDGSGVEVDWSAVNHAENPTVAIHQIANVLADRVALAKCLQKCFMYTYRASERPSTERLEVTVNGLIRLHFQLQHQDSMQTKLRRNALLHRRYSIATGQISQHQQHRQYSTALPQHQMHSAVDTGSRGRGPSVLQNYYFNSYGWFRSAIEGTNVIHQSGVGTNGDGEPQDKSGNGAGGNGSSRLDGALSNQDNQQSSGLFRTVAGYEGRYRVSNDLPRPCQTLILYQRPRDILAKVPDSSTTLAYFVRTLSPLMSIANVAAELGMPLKQAMVLAEHLVYWRQAAVMFPLAPQTRVCISSQASLGLNSELTHKFDDAFPMRPFHQVLAEYMDMEPLGDMLNQKLVTERQGEINVLLWLLRRRLVTQMVVYMYLSFGSSTVAGDPTEEPVALQAVSRMQRANYIQDHEARMLLQKSLGVIDSSQWDLLCEVVPFLRGQICLDEIAAIIERSYEDILGLVDIFPNCILLSVQPIN